VDRQGECDRQVVQRGFNLADVGSLPSSVSLPRPLVLST
jgi:hypothetical protein